MFRILNRPDSGALLQQHIPQGARRRLYNLVVRTWDFLHPDPNTDTSRPGQDQDQYLNNKNTITCWNCRINASFVSVWKMLHSTYRENEEKRENIHENTAGKQKCISIVALKRGRTWIMMLRRTSSPCFWNVLQSLVPETETRPECQGWDEMAWKAALGLAVTWPCSS